MLPMRISESCCEREERWREATARRGGALSAAEIGSIHHAFLELVSFDKVGGVEDLGEEARRLEKAGLLTPEQTALLDLEGVAAFWSSELGMKIRTHTQQVERELAFTVRFSPEELGTFLGPDPESRGEALASSEPLMAPHPEPPHEGGDEPGHSLLGPEFAGIRN